MSQHYYCAEWAGVPVTVLLYLDEHNQAFMVIATRSGGSSGNAATPIDGGEFESRTLYASRHDPAMAGASAAGLQAALHRLGVGVHEPAFAALRSDQLRHAAPRCVVHGPDGSMVEA
jgi:hypothetical protein